MIHVHQTADNAVGEEDTAGQVEMREMVDSETGQAELRAMKAEIHH